MAKKKGKRTVVGSPLTPSLLAEMGALSGFPPASADFEPAGGWTNTYRIWTCHGYRESGNYDVGFLRIERAFAATERLRPRRRAGGGPAGTFKLRVNQKVVSDEGAVHSVRAEIECRSDPLASPVRWELSSRLVGPDGEPRAELSTEESCLLDADTIEVRTARLSSPKSTRKRSERLTGDWCLFEAIQRLPFREGPALVFDLMEGMSLLKEGHRLSYAGAGKAGAGKGRASMHRFVQTGHGILPYEYWLDERHRLLVVVTLSRAYILDDRAEEKIEPRIKWGRRSFQRRLEASGGGGSR